LPVRLMSRARSLSKTAPTGGLHVTSELYCDFPQSSLTCAMGVEKVIGGKRDRLTHLPIRNHEPPKTSLYASVVGETLPMNLFGL